MTSGKDDLDHERLKFEQQKWRDELALRQQEIDLKRLGQKSQEDEIKLKREELDRSRWSSPLVVAILGATLAGGLNLIVNVLSASDQRRLDDGRARATADLEKEKAEAARILEVVKTGDPDKAADNLKVLLDTYLITDKDTRVHLQTYLDNREAGQGIALSSAGSQVTRSNTSWQPLPTPIGKPPYRLDLADVTGVNAETIKKSGKLAFQVTANTGWGHSEGVQTGQYQDGVARSLQAELQSAKPEDRPSFLYLLGNIVFFDGDPDEYQAQFYEPYSHYAAPIFAIPGNHDGQIPNGQPQRKSLDGFVANFSAGNQRVAPGSTMRTRMAQPNVYWTLVTPYATIVGLYTNVPARGDIDQAQIQWLHGEMRAAPRDRALIIAMHHSPFSFDVFHSGSARMSDVLVDAINETRRIPNAVISAGSFDYQRIEFDVFGSKIPFFVIGGGGYPKLHKLANGELPIVDAGVGASLLAANDRNHGFATFEIDANEIKGHFTSLGSPGDPGAPGSWISDNFAYSGTAMDLPAGRNINGTH